MSKREFIKKEIKILSTNPNVNIGARQFDNIQQTSAGDTYAEIYI